MEQASSPLEEASPNEERLEGNSVTGTGGGMDEEDDVQTGSRRHKVGDAAMAQEAEEEADDLFGDDDDGDMGDLGQPGYVWHAHTRRKFF